MKLEILPPKTQRNRTKLCKWKKKKIKHRGKNSRDLQISFIADRRIHRRRKPQRRPVILLTTNFLVSSPHCFRRIASSLFLPLFSFSLQIAQKSLTEAFVSPIEDVLPGISKESFDFSPISSISDAIYNDETAEVRVNYIASFYVLRFWVRIELFEADKLNILINSIIALWVMFNAIFISF